MMAAWIAAVWAATFGLVHMYWAVGGRVGLGDQAAADEAFERAWFAIFNVAAGLGCLIAAGLALAAVHRWGRHLPRRLLVAGLWAVAVLLVARGGIGAAQYLTSQQTGAEQISPALALYDAWFLFGGAAFTILAWHHPRSGWASRCDRQQSAHGE